MARRFAGGDLGIATAPVETATLRFRHLLEERDLCGEILDSGFHAASEAPLYTQAFYAA